MFPVHFVSSSARPRRFWEPLLRGRTVSLPAHLEGFLFLRHWMCTLIQVYILELIHSWKEAYLVWGKGKKYYRVLSFSCSKCSFSGLHGACPVFVLSKLPMEYLFFEFGKRFLFCYIFILVSPFCLKILIYQLGQFTVHVIYSAL